MSTRTAAPGARARLARLALLAALGASIACTGRAEPAASAPTASAPTASAATAPAATPAAATPAAAGPPGRVVAIGDLHAELDSALAVLQLAGVVDAEGRWSGGNTTLVQTGDTTDRGPDSKEVIELLMRLEGEAAAAGGRVVALLGNHEAMNLTGDWRYVSPGDVADFGSEQARRAAFAADGPLGAWLLERDAVARVGDIVFVHGGVSERHAGLGVEGLAQGVRAALRGEAPPLLLGQDGPLWYRGYLQNDEPLACAELGRSLVALGARRMVVGHTTQRSGRIATRCGGQLLGIDTGISGHYGRHLAAVEIVAGDARALYPAGPEDLPDP